MTTIASPFPPPTVPGAGPSGENPYVGPRPMRRGEIIHGRAGEITKIRGLLVSNRVLLLYSPSGAGKTSLIEAGLLPQLEERGFVVFPTVRVGHELPAAGRSGANRYCLSVIASLEEGRAADEQLDPDALASADLGEYFDGIADRFPDGRLCLVFDQFEEVFTLNPADVAAKRAFLEQLGAALKNRRFWVLIAMREDFIAQLDPYLDLLPTQLRTRFRLGLLGYEAAIESAIATAELAGVRFRDDAALKLVNDLRTIQVDHPDGPRDEQGPHVEPLQLQVVCRRLWEQPRADPSTIGEDDVKAGGGVDTALSDYYDAEIERVEDETRTGEREIRKWFSDDLITEDGFRKPTRKGPGERGQDVLEQLTDRHLLRRERRSGTDWYELTHDRFVEPIRESNRRFDDQRRSTRLKRIMAIGLVVAVLIGIAIAVLVIARNSDAVRLKADRVELPIEGIEVELDPGAFARYVFDPSDVDVIEATLRYADESSGSTARLRLLGVDDDGLGAELTATSLRRTTAAPAAGAPDEGIPRSSGPTLGSQEETTAVIRRTVGGNDESLVVEVASESGGSFVLAIQGAADQGGPVEIGVDDAPLEAEIIAAGDIVTASLEDVDAGDTFRVVVSPAEDFDPVVAVRTSDGDEIGFSDLGPEGFEETVTVSLPDDDVIVEISGFEGSTGLFELVAQGFDPVPLTVGGPAIDGTVEDDPAFFLVDGGEGERVHVVVTPDAGFDPILRFTSGAAPESASDRAGPGGAESLTTELSAEVVNHLEVAGFDGSTGGFSIAVEPVDARPLDIGGSPVTGTVDAGPAIFVIEAEDDADVRVIVTADANFDPILTMTATGGIGNVSDYSSDGGVEALTAVLTDEQEYYVEVAGYEGSTGGFSIVVEPIDPVPLAIDETVNGTIDASGTSETYRVVFPAGATVESFDVVLGDGLSAALELSAYDGSISYVVGSEQEQVIEEEAWPELEFFVEEELLLTLTSLQGTSGTYDLRVVPRN